MGTSAFSLATYWETNTPPLVWGMGEMGVKRGNGGVGWSSSSDRLSYWDGYRSYGTLLPPSEEEKDDVWVLRRFFKGRAGGALIREDCRGLV